MVDLGLSCDGNVNDGLSLSMKCLLGFPNFVLPTEIGLGYKSNFECMEKPL